MNQELVKDSIKDRVHKVISEHLGVDIKILSDDKDLCHDIGADSLDCVEVGMAIEEEFHIEIPDADFDKIQTVGDIILYVRNNI